MSDNILRPDICVVGAGAAGLSVAAGAAQLGAETVLIEAGLMGGDCLNFGCVPSKALIAAAQHAHNYKTARDFGIAVAPPDIDPVAVRAHIHDRIAAIAPHDSVARFTGLGVKVIKAHARFADPRTLIADDATIRARRFVLATGASPLVPNIPGIRDVPYFTNETIFGLGETVRHLIVIGGGPIGVELAQAYARLGADVTLLEMAHILPREDAALAERLRAILSGDGVRLLEGVRVASVESPGLAGGGIRIALTDAKGDALSIEGSHLLLATGRKPRVEGLDLEKANILFDARGIAVDARLRTSNRRVLALGDCIPGPAFTHAAAYQAGLVIQGALFRLPVKADYSALPRVTYTDPELAQIGLTAAEAKAHFPDCRIIEVPLSENNRAVVERASDGIIKVMATPRGHVLGVSILAAHAGELLAPWCLMMKKKLKLSALAGTVLPYPTFAEISKRAAGQFYAPRLFSDPVRRLVAFLRHFG